MIDYITYKPTGDRVKDMRIEAAIRSELIAMAENQAKSKDITYEFRYMNGLPGGLAGIEIRSRKRRKPKDDKRTEDQKGR